MTTSPLDMQESWSTWLGGIAEMWAPGLSVLGAQAVNHYAWRREGGVLLNIAQFSPIRTRLYHEYWWWRAVLCIFCSQQHRRCCSTQHLCFPPNIIGHFPGACWCLSSGFIPHKHPAEGRLNWWKLNPPDSLRFSSFFIIILTNNLSWLFLI